MLKSIITILLLSFMSLLCAEEIDDLLGAYEKASELSNKTKDEAAGNLVVYTRDDLERMQANTLKDIIKSIRFFHYAENRLAQPDMLNADPVTYYSKSIRIYLNDHELLNPIAGSGFILFGDMELDFIDHIEIYEGFPSFDFGIEPATIVFRLYTKTAGHDAGGRVKLQGGSYGANTESGYYADEFDGLSYFAYAGRYDNRRKEFEHDGETLWRNRRTERVYASLASEDHRIELHGSHQKGDGFIGSAVVAVPESTKEKNRYLSAALHSTFQDKTLTLDIALLQNISDFEYHYNTPGLQLHDQQIREDSYTAGLKKDLKFSNHNLTFGIQFRHKHFDLTDLVLDIPVSYDQPYYTEDVYSAFVQNEYAVDDNRMLTFSLMGQHYHRKHSSADNQDTFQGRLGYIYTDNDWVSKTFLSHQEFAAEPYMTISPHYGNSALEKESYFSIFQEIAYLTDKTLTKMILGYGKNEDTPIIDPATFTMRNSNKDIYGYSAALEWTLFFAENDKLELQGFVTYLESAYEGGDTSKHHGAVVRMLNSVNSLDLFNELVIREGFSKVSNAHDYSAGIIYHATPDLKFNIKGENIFDDGLEWSYANRFDPVTQQVTDSVIVPVIERRFRAGMEYLF